MEKIRTPLQGVWNIVRFNWHFYMIAGCLILVMLFFRINFPASLQIITDIFMILILVSILISLIISSFIYDFSELYELSWLDKLQTINREKIVNINAGFDETSALLKNKYPTADLIVYDFYDPKVHTEISIKRARKIYPPYPNTQPINTNVIPLEDNSINKIFVILSAHEIRNSDERIKFFKELRRVLAASGKIIVTEHLRDAANLLAYNVGAFHFYSRTSWHKIIQSAGLRVKEEIKITPFITTFIIEKNGTAS